MFNFFGKKETSLPRVLVVDDNPDLVAAVITVLGKQQYDVKSAHNGPSALKMAEQFQPDVILLDVMMPGMDGGEVLSELKQNPKTKDIPVLMLTVMNDMKDVEKHFLGGAAGYIIKPYKNERLMESVRSILEKNKTGGTVITGYVPSAEDKPDGGK